MYLSEYQAKEILARYGVNVPEGGLARTPGEAEERARALKCERFAVKAQILAGGRGLAGGVRLAPTPSAVRDAAEALLGTRLVTEQTGPAGEVVERVYVEAAVDDRRSVYLALVIDEREAVPRLLGAREGGVAFEAKAHADPGILESLALPVDGDLSRADVPGFLARIGVEGPAAACAATLVAGMVRAAFEIDALLVEINPLAITPEGRAVAVDAKMVLDDSALYRHPEFEGMAREAHRDAYERAARENEINFVRMDGNIGVVVNGAGLGLATNDMLIDAGGRPANFMDIRTTATSFQIARGVGVLLEDPAVRVILVNVHGGGMTVCDTVAEGINFAYSRSARKVPIVFRAAGQNAAWALTIMKDRRLPFERVDDISGAAARAVALARGAA
jgi:succinyl-CoA synthetase beta subunit